MANLWKVTVRKESGKVLKGMSVEIAISDRSSKPRAKEIVNAFQAKYNVEVSESKCSESYFDIEKI